MNRLENKVAIITGGASGMGESHVRAFLDEGAKVVFTDLDEESGKKIESEFDDNVLFVKHDVTDPSAWDDVIKKANDKFGEIDILVNNAGIVITKSFEDHTLEVYQKTLDVNQHAIFYGMQKVLPSMKKAGGGSIINISSLSGLIAGPLQFAYVTSKFAVRGMSKAAATELAQYNIRVNSVHPGVIETPIIETPETQESIKDLIEMIPMGRTAQADEVSKLVVFLASDESSYSTASEFIIDGGLHAI